MENGRTRRWRARGSAGSTDSSDGAQETSLGTVLDHQYAECLYVIEREQGLQQAQRAIGIIDQLALHVVAADRSLVFEAAHVTARHSISDADSFSVALAKRHYRRVMTGDPELKAIEPSIPIHWLPDRRDA